MRLYQGEEEVEVEEEAEEEEVEAEEEGYVPRRRSCGCAAPNP